MHVISYRPTDLSLLKEFLKNSVLKIFIVLFEQNCPGQWSMASAITNHITARYSFKQKLAAYLAFRPFFQLQKGFDPIRCWYARELWSQKTKLPKSFKAFQLFSVKYHQNEEKSLMKSCKNNLCYKAYNDDDETEIIDDIALPFFEAMKIYIIKVPTKGTSINFVR